ncbi:hypothetical protein PQR66_22995 [Paraburkholderia agricolaris]|uniref:Uncharacterized protein n=1 Tax=Paraburkholderia agricolaris TaxID=2152888 RepID=A0ABW8ZSS2_9BURK
MFHRFHSILTLIDARRKKTPGSHHANFSKHAITIRKEISASKFSEQTWPMFQVFWRNCHDRGNSYLEISTKSTLIVFPVRNFFRAWRPGLHQADRRLKAHLARLERDPARLKISNVRFRV